MSLNIDRNPVEFFTVVGAAYVPEHHDDGNKRTVDLLVLEQPAFGIASLWLVFYAAIVGASIFSSGGAAKLVEVAAVVSP